MAIVEAKLIILNTSGQLEVVSKHTPDRLYIGNEDYYPIFLTEYGELKFARVYELKGINLKIHEILYEPDKDSYYTVPYASIEEKQSFFNSLNFILN